MMSFCFQSTCFNVFKALKKPTFYKSWFLSRLAWGDNEIKSYYMIRYHKRFSVKGAVRLRPSLMLKTSS